jgi:hypothetical protein
MKEWPSLTWKKQLPNGLATRKKAINHEGTKPRRKARRCSLRDNFVPSWFIFLMVNNSHLGSYQKSFVFGARAKIPAMPVSRLRNAERATRPAQASALACP